MEFINRMRKDKKGFTLVEIIVVLVILAILAAFMIPSMLGFVNDAKKKAAVAEQREIYVAAQAIATEQFGKYGENDATGGPSKLGMAAIASGSTDTVAVNLGSGEVQTVATAEALSDASAKATALAKINDVTKAMANYLGKDITAGDGTGNAALWTVFVDNNGKVTKVTYQKNGLTLDPLVPSASIN